MELLSKDEREHNSHGNSNGGGHSKRKSFSRTMTRNPRVEVGKVLGGGLGKKDRKNFALLILLCEYIESGEEGGLEGRRLSLSLFRRGSL